MDLFNLAAKLTLDGGAFDKGMKKATKEGENLAKRLTRSFNTISRAAKALIGGAVVKTVVGSMKSLIDSSAAFGDAIDKNSQRLNFSKQAYQDWEYILGQSGASIESMQLALRNLNESIASLGGNTEEAKKAEKAFKTLGVDMDLLKSLSPEDQFDYLVHQFQQMPDGLEKSTIALQLFGRSASDLIPLLNTSSAEMYALRDEAKRLGLYMSDEGVATAVAYGDAVDTMKRTFTALKNAVGVDLMRTFIPAVKAITDYASQIKKAYEDNGLVGVFKKLVDDVKAIKWPTWDDVSTAIQEGWNTIVLGVEGLSRIVFGENVDGTIKYPTWESVGETIGNAWNGIVEGVSALWKTVGRIIFGTSENEDITIEFPTWEKIKQAVEGAWKAIVDGVAGLGTGIGKAVFGQNVDGSIRWPTWDDVGGLVSRGWSSIVRGVEGLAKIVFDALVDIGVPLPDWDTIKGAITEGWGKVKGAFDQLLELVFGKKVDGSIDYPSWDTIKSNITEGWNKVTGAFEKLAKIVFGTKLDGSIDFPSWDTIKSKITDGWNTVVGAFNELKMLVFGSKVDGKVELPNLTKMKVAAAELWGRFVEWVGKLGGLVFGRDENGDVNWPDWATLEALAGKLWDSFKAAVGKLGGLIFGRDTEGSVKWPNWGDLQKVAKGAWKLFTGGIAKLGGLIFGRDEKGDVNWPSLDDLLKFASGLWSDLCAAVGKFTGLIFGVDDIDAVANTFRSLGDALKYVSAAIIGGTLAKKVKGLSDTIGSIISFKGGKLSGWTKFELIMAGLAAASLLIYEHWDEISEFAKQAGTWINENIIAPVGELFNDVKGWITENIVEPIKSAFEWIKGAVKDVLAFFGIGTGDLAKDLQGKIQRAAVNISTPQNRAKGFEQIAEMEKLLEMTPEELATEYEIDDEEARQTLVWLAKELSKLTDKTYTLKFAVEGFGGGEGLGGAFTEKEGGGRRKSDGSHAKGLWTVPYDNYLASLHRGERVLTASQARHMGESADGATIAAAVSSAVSKAMQDLSLVLNNRTVGKVFGDSTSRRVNKNINLTAERLAYGHGK